LAKRRVPFRLRGFSPPGRFAPSLILRVCCTPLPTLGFIVLRCSFFQPCGQRNSVPSTMRHPSKLFPLQQPSLSGFLPSCRWPSKDGVVSGFFSAGESVIVHSCCHERTPDAPLGFSLSSSGHLLLREGSESPRGPCGPSPRGLVRVFQGVPLKVVLAHDEPFFRGPSPKRGFHGISARGFMLP